MLAEVGTHCQPRVSLTSGQEISVETFELLALSDHPAPISAAPGPDTIPRHPAELFTTSAAFFSSTQGLVLRRGTQLAFPPRS